MGENDDVNVADESKEETVVDLERRAYELETLNAIAQELNRSVDLDMALQSTLAQAADFFGLEMGWIWLLNPETGLSYVAASQNLPPVLADNPRRLEGSCYCLDTFFAGDMDGAANVNVITCSRLKHVVEGADGLRYHASVPLYAHGEKLGVLNVASADWRELSSDDLRLLHTVGDMLSIAIDRAQLFATSVEFGAVNERNRLAREIHDTLSQGLAAVQLQLETADALLETKHEQKDERLRRAVQAALTLTRSNLEEARRSVHDLRAVPLEGRSLAEALHGLLSDIQSRCDVEIRFDVTGRDQPLPVAVEAGLYRVAQEALSNIDQHAGATEIALTLLVTPQQVELSIADNGHGFEPEQANRERFGLTGMNERMHLLGGTFHIESTPGQGAQVRVRVPLIASERSL